MIYRRDQSNDRHAGSDQPPEQTMLMHTGLAAAEIRGDAEVPVWAKTDVTLIHQANKSAAAI